MVIEPLRWTVSNRLRTSCNSIKCASTPTSHKDPHSSHNGFLYTFKRNGAISLLTKKNIITEYLEEKAGKLVTSRDVLPHMNEPDDSWFNPLVQIEDARIFP